MNRQCVYYAITETEYKQVISKTINYNNNNYNTNNYNNQDYNNINNGQKKKRYKKIKYNGQDNTGFSNNKYICNRNCNNNWNRNNNVNLNNNSNVDININNNMNNKQDYHFVKSNYNFILSKKRDNTFIIYMIKHNHNLNEIKFPKHLYSITNDNYIYDKLLNIINNTNSFNELNIQWNIISNIIDTICPISNTKTFINYFNNVISNLN